MNLQRLTASQPCTLCLSVFHLKGVRDSFTGGVHHRYLIPMHVLVLLLASRCGCVCSRDVRARAVTPAVEEWQASWPIKAMQEYCVSFYCWSVLTKLRISGRGWFGSEGRIQEVLRTRSAL
jgi:hypothetical protein